MSRNYPEVVPRNASSLNLSESDKVQLLQWSTAFGTPQQVALRCRIVLAAEGLAEAASPLCLPFFADCSSWLNLIERWFGELTSKRIRRGSFGSVPHLKQAIDEFLAAWNEKLNPFVWTAK
jgi:hypothetical protein